MGHLFLNECSKNEHMAHYEIMRQGPGIPGVVAKTGEFLTMEIVLIQAFFIGSDP